MKTIFSSFKSVKGKMKTEDSSNTKLIQEWVSPVDLQFCFEHYMKLYALKNRNFQACVVVCNFCKAT